MKIILKETVENLGTVGDIVTVKDGYGRNYLIPNGLATMADPKKVKVIEHNKRALESKRKRELTKATDLAKELETLTLVFKRKSSDHDHLFGSVTPADVEKAVSDKGYTLSKKQVVIEKPIKALGEYSIVAKLPGGVKANLKIVVEGTDA